MDSLQHVRIRRSAVSNVGKITKAMEVVSATKMRRSQQVALASRPYAMAALKLLYRVTEHAFVETIYTTPREAGRTLLVVVASDRGLTGAFNAQVLRKMDEYLESLDEKPLVVAVGKKAVQYAIKKNLEIVAEFSGYGDFVDYGEVMPLADIILREFESNPTIQRVVTLSMHFRTTLKQEVLTRRILPTSAEKINETIKEIAPEHGRFSEEKKEASHAPDQRAIEYIVEPSREEISRRLVPYLIRMQIYQLILEANASEHSARRVAMKTASDNADELARKLTRSYNKARQALITNEIIEITSTQNALSS